MAAHDPYLVRLRRARREVVAAMAAAVPLGTAAASEAWALTGALVLAGLARHDRRRGGTGAAAAQVLAKYARTADLDAPAIAIRAHLAHPDLDPRLGGLLGDATALACAWGSPRAGAGAPALARAVAAGAPLALGALASLGEDAPALARRCAAVDLASLAEPQVLERGGGTPGDTYRHLRRRGIRALLGR